MHASIAEGSPTRHAGATSAQRIRRRAAVLANPPSPSKKASHRRNLGRLRPRRRPCRLRRRALTPPPPFGGPPPQQMLGRKSGGLRLARLTLPSLRAFTMLAHCCRSLRDVDHARSATCRPASSVSTRCSGGVAHRRRCARRLRLTPLRSFGSAFSARADPKTASSAGSTSA